jgi:hypothetical protein
MAYYILTLYWRLILSDIEAFAGEHIRIIPDFYTLKINLFLWCNNKGYALNSLCNVTAFLFIQNKAQSRLSSANS